MVKKFLSFVNSEAEIKADCVYDIAAFLEKEYLPAWWFPFGL